MDPVAATGPIVVPPAPPASSPAAARTMRANRRRDTGPELALRRELWRRGLRYLVDATPPGTSRRRRADVVLRGARLAVFVDGCFWHSCPVHLHVPKANRDWWTVKLASIVERDRRTDAELLAAGWLPVRVWEHEDPVAAADRLLVLVGERRGSLELSLAALTHGPVPPSAPGSPALAARRGSRRPSSRGRSRPFPG